MGGYLIGGYLENWRAAHLVFVSSKLWVPGVCQIGQGHHEIAATIVEVETDREHLAHADAPSPPELPLGLAALTLWHPPIAACSSGTSSQEMD